MMQAPVHYCAAKAALKGFTEALAKEFGRYGITVNCLAPGVLDEGVSGTCRSLGWRSICATARSAAWARWQRPPRSPPSSSRIETAT